jgi:DNA-binding MarR family transcriptional regulator
VPDATGSYTPAELRHLMHRKALAAERFRAASARKLGVTDSEAAALAHLASQGQLTPRELGLRLGLTSGGTTTLIHRLEAAGHVERHPHPHDRRSLLVTASASAVARAEELYSPLVAELDAVFARLGERERATVGSCLAEVTAVSERHAERLRAAASAGATDVVAAPAPGLWA